VVEYSRVSSDEDADFLFLFRQHVATMESFDSLVSMYKNHF
jgi:hypothetical protein